MDWMKGATEKTQAVMMPETSELNLKQPFWVVNG